MNRLSWITFATLTACLAFTKSVDAAEQEKGRAKTTGLVAAAEGDENVFEGLWSGTWGGGGRNGVVFQPVVAKLLVEGDHIELRGFPKIDRLTGTVRFDARAKRMRIAPLPDSDGPPSGNIVYAYEISDDELTLRYGDSFSISLSRRPVTVETSSISGVNFVTADGIDNTGDLLVTESRMVLAGQAARVYFEPVKMSLKTKRATVLLTQESGWKEVTLDEARRLIRGPTLVVVAYRQDNRPAQRSSDGPWREMGPPTPDGKPAWRTLSQVLRPGTMVFVLSARQNVPHP